MADLESKKWDKIAAEVEFNPEIMKSHYNVPVFLSTDSSFHLGKNAAKICIRCKGIFPLENCSNCGSDQYVPGISTDRIAGLFCFECERGTSSWVCPSCQTTNPINKSLAVEKKGCFIATVVYGSYDSPEVILLRQFRDKTLSRTSFGNNIVKFYYTISPNVANLISKTSILSKVIKTMFLYPFIKFLKFRKWGKRA